MQAAGGLATLPNPAPVSALPLPVASRQGSPTGSPPAGQTAEGDGGAVYSEAAPLEAAARRAKDPQLPGSLTAFAFGSQQLVPGDEQQPAPAAACQPHGKASQQEGGSGRGRARQPPALSASHSEPAFRPAFAAAPGSAASYPSALGRHSAGASLPGSSLGRTSPPASTGAKSARPWSAGAAANGSLAGRSQPQANIPLLATPQGGPAGTVGSGQLAPLPPAPTAGPGPRPRPRPLPLTPPAAAGDAEARRAGEESGFTVQPAPATSQGTGTAAASREDSSLALQAAPTKSLDTAASVATCPPRASSLNSRPIHGPPGSLPQPLHPSPGRQQEPPAAGWPLPQLSPHTPSQLPLPLPVQLQRRPPSPALPHPPPRSFALQQGQRHQPATAPVGSSLLQEQHASSPGAPAGLPSTPARIPPAPQLQQQLRESELATAATAASAASAAPRSPAGREATLLLQQAEAQREELWGLLDRVVAAKDSRLKEAEHALWDLQYEASAHVYLSSLAMGMKSCLALPCSLL